MRKIHLLTIILAGAVLFSGCAGPAKSGQPPPAQSEAESAVSSFASTPAPAAPEESTPPVEASRPPAAPACFFDAETDAILEGFALPEDADDFEKVKACFNHVIESTFFIAYDQPELTDCWRCADDCGQVPSVYQAMAASPLLFGLGSCENYASLLVVLLERMGFEALFVPGLTYSVDGGLVDHAWVMVKLAGEWYHADPQLEDNITRGAIAYKYFLKNDVEFAAHHVWGNNLPNPDPHSRALPPCTGKMPTPQPRPVDKGERPSLEQALEQAQALRQAEGDHYPGQELAEALPPFPGDFA